MAGFEDVLGMFSLVSLHPWVFLTFTSEIRRESTKPSGMHEMQMQMNTY